MSDTKDKIKDGIDDAAHKAKQTTEKVADKAKDAAYESGRRSRKPVRKLRTRGSSVPCSLMLVRRRTDRFLTSVVTRLRVRR